MRVARDPRRTAARRASVDEPRAGERFGWAFRNTRTNAKTTQAEMCTSPIESPTVGSPQYGRLDASAYSSGVPALGVSGRVPRKLGGGKIISCLSTTRPRTARSGWPSLAARLLECWPGDRTHPAGLVERPRQFRADDEPLPRKHEITTPSLFRAFGLSWRIC